MAFYGYNPYQQYQQPQYQYQYQPQVQMPALSGRMVNSFDEVTANDVPMNGTMAVFPKADLSEIECRQWNANGTISKIVYKPILEDKPNTLSSEIQNKEYEAIKGQLDTLYTMLQSLLDRKEVDAE